MGARHNTNQCPSITSGPHLSFGIFDVSTKGCCDPCSFGRSVSTSSPSVTCAFLYIAVLKLGSTIWCTSLNCANSTMVTNALALSHQSERLQGLRKSVQTAFSKDIHHHSNPVTFFQRIRHQLQRTDHMVTTLHLVPRTRETPLSQLLCRPSGT